MDYILIVIIAAVEALVLGAVLYFSSSKSRGGSRGTIVAVEKVLEEKKNIWTKIDQLYEGMVDLGSVQTSIAELKSVEESLKAERGRITITQAELETVEARLRELEEIERELEASGIETQQELNILKKKEEGLRVKNSQLKEQITASTSQLDQLISELEANSQAQQQIQQMKTELLQSETRIDTLLLEVEQSNEQYFIMKKRYDALDIEYAQLYEKFSESEGAAGGSSEE